MNAITNTTLVNPNDIQDGRSADKWQDKLKLPKGAEITPYQALRAVIEMRKTNVAGDYGFRIRLLSDETGDPRLVHAATQYADDHALGVEGVRGERLGIGGGDHVSSAGGYTQTQLDALTRHRKATQALGPIESALIFEIVINCVNATKLATVLAAIHRKPMTDKTAVVRAREALEHLADIYEGKRK